MHDFVPRPHYSSEEWRIRSSDVEGSNKPNCAVDMFSFPFTENTWFAWGGFASEPAAPPSGYIFPLDTITDLVLWLRWAVCGIAFDEESEDGIDEDTQRIVDTALKTIDRMPDGTDAQLVLDKLPDLVEEYFDGFELFLIESIHDYLERYGSVEEWRVFLEDPSIQKVGDRWSMSPEGWENLTEHCRHVGFTAVSPSDSQGL